MCGVIGLVCSKDRDDLGEIASTLLRALQYRGYDSTGAAAQTSSGEVDLRKAVGAPTDVVPRLGIDGMRGRILCGQVRWATFGAVDELNAQPHEVRCHTHLYGAHNGNVTNTDAMQAWLRSAGHRLASDNDGEVVVHTVEHYFAEALEAESDRRRALRLAVSRACEVLEGSFAAVVIDPVERHLMAVKRGSSLYVGVASDVGGDFALVSSDLGGVLTQTTRLVPLNTGEMVALQADEVFVYAVGAPDTPLERSTVQSELRLEDTSLQPPFRSFMEQEIHAQPATLRALQEAFDDQDSEFARAANALCERMLQTFSRGGDIHVVCCGTSFHAAGAAAVFFAEVAAVPIHPSLPGEFAARRASLLSPDDLFIAVSQSGETKDLIDVVDLARERGVAVMAIVNNVRSTLGQEKAELVLPLLCGPEIAVPATKSFIAQLGLFYGLAHYVARLAGREVSAKPDLAALVERVIAESGPAIGPAAEMLHMVPSLHILATRMLPIAKEGALKVREVVLNHTEGFEGSEFKHGPNTILGVNTVFGLHQVQALLEAVLRDEASDQSPAERMAASFDALYADYPLIYVTGPAERDVDLTISQLHTHKIRGSSSIVVAEDVPRLREAAERPPAGSEERYQSVFVPLPRTGDSLQTFFSSTVALQLLALRMSEKKRAVLDALGIRGHGVDPDAPKNVSKSITVD